MNSKDLKVGDIVYHFNGDKCTVEKFIVKFIVDRNFCIASKIEEKKNIFGGDNTEKNESHCIAFLEKSEIDCLTDQLESVERDIQSTEACLERKQKKKAKIERMIRVLKKKQAKEKKNG